MLELGKQKEEKKSVTLSSIIMSELESNFVESVGNGLLMVRCMIESAKSSTLIHLASVYMPIVLDILVKPQVRLRYSSNIH